MFKAILNDFSENTYIVANGKEAYVIDPGSNYEAMHQYLQEHGLSIKGVLLTHGHYDHISGLNNLLEEEGAPIYIHKDDRDFLFDPGLNLSVYMEERFKLKDKHVVHTMEEGDTFSLGKESITVLHTPGHTRGGVCFLYGDVLFSGDTLFKEAVGRMDLPTGDESALLASVSKLLERFDDNTVVYPGHGPFTTIAHEKAKNPFVKG